MYRAVDQELTRTLPWFCTAGILGHCLSVRPNAWLCLRVTVRRPSSRYMMRSSMHCLCAQLVSRSHPTFYPFLRNESSRYVFRGGHVSMLCLGGIHHGRQKLYHPVFAIRRMAPRLRRSGVQWHPVRIFTHIRNQLQPDPSLHHRTGILFFMCSVVD
jgi:hypothetical protein